MYAGPAQETAARSLRSEGAIARAARSENERELRAVMAAHGPIVLGVATRILRDPTLAEDVAQDTFVAFWNRTEDVDAARGSARSLLCSIARNKAIDLVRREETRRRVLSAEASLATPASLDESTQIDDRDALLRALRSITPVQREAIELAYFGGHTYSEVARQLGVAEGTAKTRLRDGLLALRRVFMQAASA